jgi:hypothetical protein
MDGKTQMKIKKILHEVLDDALFERMKVEASTAIEMAKIGERFYRGIDYARNMPIQRVESRIRKSLASHNYANMLFDYFNEGGDAQKRTRSNIFSDSFDVAYEYGLVGMVFPINGALLTFGKSSDNYDNFKRPIANHLRDIPTDLDSFNRFLSNLFKVTGYTAALIDDPEKIDNFIDALDNSANKLINSDDIDPDGKMLPLYEKGFEFIQGLKTSSEFMDRLKKIFSVSNNTDIVTREIEEGVMNGHKEVEIWTESPCYILSMNSIYVEQLGVSPRTD